MNWPTTFQFSLEHVNGERCFPSYENTFHFSRSKAEGRRQKPPTIGNYVASGLNRKKLFGNSE